MPSFSVYILHKHWFSLHHLCLREFKIPNAIQNRKRGGEGRGRLLEFSYLSDLLCFAIHGRSLLNPTESMASLCKPKQTHLCPSGSENLSCLTFRYSWAHPILAIMKRVIYSSFVSSPVSRKHDQCLSLLALPNFSQHLLPTGFMRCKVRKAITFPIQSQYTIDWQVIQQRALKSGASPTFNQTVL